MQDRMLGVVLWADASDMKAVIWCEDHGNLAYYSAPEQNVHEGIALDAGDLIQFELREERDTRHASNPRRVDAGFAPQLVQELRGQGGHVANETVTPGRPNVVPFPRRAC